jgi:hypothetical protein
MRPRQGDRIIENNTILRRGSWLTKLAKKYKYAVGILHNLQYGARHMAYCQKLRSAYGISNGEYAWPKNISKLVYIYGGMLRIERFHPGEA